MRLVKLKSKMKSGKENTKGKAESQVSVPRKRQGIVAAMINIEKKKEVFFKR